MSDLWRGGGGNCPTTPASYGPVYLFSQKRDTFNIQAVALMVNFCDVLCCWTYFVVIVVVLHCAALSSVVYVRVVVVLCSLRSVILCDAILRYTIICFVAMLYYV